MMEEGPVRSANIDSWYGVFDGAVMIACFPWRDEADNWASVHESDYRPLKVRQVFARTEVTC